MRSVIIALLLTAWPGSSQTDEENPATPAIRRTSRNSTPGNVWIFLKAIQPRESTGMIPLTALGKIQG